MDAIKFLRDAVVDGVPYRAGDVAPADRIPAGSLESMGRLGWVVKQQMQPITVKAEAAPPKPGTKK